MTKDPRLSAVTMKVGLLIFILTLFAGTIGVYLDDPSAFSDPAAFFGKLFTEGRFMIIMIASSLFFGGWAAVRAISKFNDPR